MRVHQRQSIDSSEIDIEEGQQENKKQNSPNKKSSGISHWLQKEIYDSISSSFQCVGQYFCVGFKQAFQILFVVALMLGAIYVIWKYILKMFVLLVVCETFIGSIPVVSDYCKRESGNSDGNIKMRALPIDSVIEKTVSIAERLSEADVSVPVKIIEVKISLIDLQTNIYYSEIEQPTKDQLIDGIDDMKTAATSTINEMYKMLASFNGALAKIEVYTRNLFNILAEKAIGTEIPSQFGTYLEHIESEIERVIFNADNVHFKLVDLDEKTKLLNDIASKAYQIVRKQLDNIEHGSLLSRLYEMTIGNGQIDRVKHQRNLEVFNRLPEFSKSTSIKIENVINRLKLFKHEIEEVKSTVSKMDRGRTLEVNLHLDILKSGVESIHNYKKYLNGRIIEANKNKL